MPPLSEKRKILQELHLLAVQDIADLWHASSLLKLDSSSFRGMITEGVPDLLDPYTATAGDLSAEWYNQSAPNLSYQATPAALPPNEQLSASSAWALYSDGQAALKRLAGLAQRTIFNAQRETIVGNVRMEQGARWARYASANACAFCRMMATRGAVYSTESSAVSVGAERWEPKRNHKGKKVGGDIGRRGRVRGNQDAGDRYHDSCRCMAVEVRPGHSYEPPGYVDEWEQQYIAAVKATPGTGQYGAIDFKAVLAHMQANTS